MLLSQTGQFDRVAKPGVETSKIRQQMAIGTAGKRMLHEKSWSQATHHTVFGEV
jgi:hypothetical protein